MQPSARRNRRPPRQGKAHPRRRPTQRKAPLQQRSGIRHRRRLPAEAGRYLPGCWTSFLAAIGDKVMFITPDDETGFANLVVQVSTGCPCRVPPSRNAARSDAGGGVSDLLQTARGAETTGQHPSAFFWASHAPCPASQQGGGGAIRPAPKIASRPSGPRSRAALRSLSRKSAADSDGSRCQISAAAAVTKGAA